MVQQKEDAQKEKCARTARELSLKKKGTQKEKPAETAGEPGPSGGRSETAGKCRSLSQGMRRENSKKTAERQQKDILKDSPRKIRKKQAAQAVKLAGQKKGMPKKKPV